MVGPNPGGPIGRATAVALLVALGVVAAWRAAGIVATPPVLAAHGERTWIGWSHRAPEAERRLAAAAARLPPARCVAVVVETDQDPPWWSVKALYHLRRHRVVEVRRAGDAAAADADCLVLEQGAAGGFGIAGRRPR
jgi:hypothetical protein